MTLPPKLEKLLDNWPAKIISLVAAILVYAFYQISTLETRYFVIPLEVRQSAGMVATSMSESSVRISIRGDITEINTLEAKDFKAFADMSNYVSDSSEIVPVQLDLSDSVRIMKDVEIKLQPETVEVTLEKELSEYIPVKLNYAGGPARGYELGEIIVKPSLIKVTGPRTLMNKIDELETDVILFDDLNQSVSIEADLMKINDKLVKEHEGPVIVDVQIEPSKMKRVINNLPVVLRNVPLNFDLEAEKNAVSITISGNELDVEDYVPSANLIYADCSGITEAGEYDIPVQYLSSSRYTVELLVPETIHVSASERVLEQTEESGE